MLITLCLVLATTTTLIMGGDFKGTDDSVLFNLEWVDNIIAVSLIYTPNYIFL